MHNIKSEYKFIATDNAGNTNEVIVKVDTIKQSSDGSPETGDSFTLFYPISFVLSSLTLFSLSRKKKN